MLASAEDCRALLRCPRTHAELQKNGEAFVSAGDGTSYPVVAGTPVMIDFENSVVARESAMKPVVQKEPGRALHKRLFRALRKWTSPVKPSTVENLKRFAGEVAAQGERPRLLVIGGGSTIGNGNEVLYEHPAIQVFAFDIGPGDNIQFIADAHKLPFGDGTFDAVMIQAVLEHVLEPQTVVEEIWRVLRPGGVVYGETPFMQQVHSGPYDFTRFTESGHRYLFRRFDLIASGPNGGPGIQLLWSIEYFARSLFRSSKAGKAAGLLFFWLHYVDRILPDDHAVDGASGVYFLGRKSDSVVGPKEVISHYQGAQ